jgi:hypothetical protein
MTFSSTFGFSLERKFFFPYLRFIAFLDSSIFLSTEAKADDDAFSEGSS